MAYAFQDFRSDFLRALANSTPGKFSGRYIGDPSKVGMWTPAKLIELYNGLLTAHNLFYFDLGLAFKDFAQVVMAECLQESTGNYNLWVGPISFTDGDAHGVIQVTPQSVLLDYHVWGQPIIDVSGTVVIRPNDVLRWDLSHNTLNIVLWAWYTRNTLAAGLSLNEYGFIPQWHGVRHQGIPDSWVNFGNALYVWLGGPRNYRERPGTDADYYLRVKDYYTHNFGTEASFERIFNTPVPKRTVALNPTMNISSEAFSLIKRQQGQPPPGIDAYTPPLRRNTTTYGVQQINQHLPTPGATFVALPSVDRLRANTSPTSYPYGLTDLEAQRYLKTIYPAWNAARLNGRQREANWAKREWRIDNQRFVL